MARYGVKYGRYRTVQPTVQVGTARHKVPGAWRRSTKVTFQLRLEWSKEHGAWSVEREAWSVERGAETRYSSRARPTLAVPSPPASEIGESPQ